MRSRRALVAALLLVGVAGSTAPREVAAQDAKDDASMTALPKGATKQTEAAVVWALRWLKSHQSPDGRWDSDGFDAQCKLNRCDGSGAEVGDVEATGLALLAFLGAGETHSKKDGSYRDTVKNGLKFLRDVQGEDGCIGPKVGKTWLRQHVIAALAVTEAYGMTGSKVFKPVAERGLAFALTARTPAARLGPDGSLDIETAGWMVTLLKSAAMSELAVDKAAMADAVADLEKLTDAATGRVVVKSPAGPMPTAVGVLGRIFADHSLEADPQIARGADLVAKSPPAWPADASGVDLVGLHFATMAMFQVGGERWQSWDLSMKNTLLLRQQTVAGRDERGSWDPVGLGAKTLGRIEATALCCLDLEVYYRYGRVLELNKEKEKETPPSPPPAGGK